MVESKRLCEQPQKDQAKQLVETMSFHARFFSFFLEGRSLRPFTRPAVYTPSPPAHPHSSCYLHPSSPAPLPINLITKAAVP